MLSQKLDGAEIPPDRSAYWPGIGSKKMGTNFNLQAHLEHSQELGRTTIEFEGRYRSSLYKALTAAYELLEQYKDRKKKDLVSESELVGYKLSFEPKSNTTRERIAVDLVFPGLDAKIASTYANALIKAKADDQTSSTLAAYLAKHTITALARSSFSSKGGVSNADKVDRTGVFAGITSKGALRNIQLPELTKDYAVILVRKEETGDISVVLATESEEAVNAISVLHGRKKAGLEQVSLSFREDQQLPEPQGKGIVLKRRELKQAA